MKNCCVFDIGKECLVRKLMSNRRKTVNKFEKIIQSTDEAQITKMYAPIFDKMRETFHDEFSQLHYYCAVCKGVKA